MSYAFACSVYITPRGEGTNHPHEYATVVSVHFRLPLTENSTFAIPEVSVAVALMVVVLFRATLALFNGLVIFTVRGVVSEGIGVGFGELVWVGV